MIYSLANQRISLLCTVLSVIFFWHDLRLLTVEDICRLIVFDHTCHRAVTPVFSDRRVSCSEIVCGVLGKHEKSIGEVINLYRLGLLGHILRIPIHQQPRRVMNAGVVIGYQKVRVGQTKT